MVSIFAPETNWKGHHKQTNRADRGSQPDANCTETNQSIVAMDLSYLQWTEMIRTLSATMAGVRWGGRVESNTPI